MTELEKMLAGMLYAAYDPELVAMRRRARLMMEEYNRTSVTEPERRRAILTELFGKVGPAVEIEPPFYVDYGTHIYAEDGLYMNTGCVILDCAEVRIGRQAFFAPYVQILAAHHPVEPAARCAGPELASPVTIGNRVWVGGGAIICPGVTIGDDTVIGAGSVVVKDIPSGVVAAGNPCRVIRTLEPGEPQV